MKRITIHAFLIVSVTLSVSAKGTEFRDITLEQALAAARAENKYVFLDAYTVWCGPCRMMADEIFPLEELGTYLNDNFICVKYDMEKGAGPQIASRYKVEGYPTFLLLDAGGREINRIVGASLTPAEFIGRVENALALGPVLDIYSQRYRDGERQVDFIREYIDVLRRNGDGRGAVRLVNEFLPQMDDSLRMSPDFWFVYEDEAFSVPGSVNAKFLMDHASGFIERVGEEKVTGKLNKLYVPTLERILMREDRFTTVNQINIMEEQIAALNIPDKEILLGYVSVILAIKDKNANSMLEAGKSLLPLLDDENLNRIYFPYGDQLRAFANSSHIQEFLDLTEDLLKEIKDEKLRNSIERYAVNRLGK